MAWRVRSRERRGHVAAVGFFAVLAGVVPPPALADEEEAESDALDRIMVCCSRSMQEHLQDIPRSVATITEAEGLSAGAEGARWDRQLAGLMLNGQNAVSGTGVRIRGIGGGLWPAVQLVVDGVPQYGFSGIGALSGEIASVQVWKGPQGARFGRQASAGVIEVTTHPLAEMRRGGAAIAADQYRRFGLAARYEDAVGEGGAFRLFAAERRTEAFPFVPTARLDDARHEVAIRAFRAVFELRPSVGATLRVVADAHSLEAGCCDDPDGPQRRALSLLDAPDTPADRHGLGVQWEWLTPWFRNAVLSATSSRQHVSGNAARNVGQGDGRVRFAFDELQLADDGSAAATWRLGMSRAVEHVAWAEPRTAALGDGRMVLLRPQRLAAESLFARVHTPSWRPISVGLVVRHTRDRWRSDRRAASNGPGGDCLSRHALPSRERVTARGSDAHAWAGDITVTYRMASDVMGYLAVSRDDHADAAVPAPETAVDAVCPLALLRQALPVTGQEIGLKFDDWTDSGFLAANVAIFRHRIGRPDAGHAAPGLLTPAITTGADLELVWTPQLWALRGGVTYADTRPVQAPAHWPIAPRWSATAAVHRSGYFGDLEWQVAVVARHVGRHVISSNHDRGLAQPSRTFADLRLSLGDRFGRWQLALWSDDVTDAFDPHLSLGGRRSVSTPGRTSGLSAQILW